MKEFDVPCGKCDPDQTPSNEVIEARLAQMEIEVSITGIDYHGEYTGEDLKTFKAFAKGADEITIVRGYLRAWWD